MSSAINVLVAEFVAKVWDAVEVEIYEKLVAALKAAMPGSAGRDVSRWTPFRDAKPGVAAALGQTKTGRPKQMCPVPGCDGVAAPLYGMVCGRHKNVAKSKIAKYRAARKAMAKRGFSQDGALASFMKYAGYRTGQRLAKGDSLIDDLGPLADKPYSRYVKKPRKSPPKQFCPVPNCKGVAAPIFGMVCGEHKDVAKSKIAKYRKARKAAKLAGSKSVKSLVKKVELEDSASSTRIARSKMYHKARKVAMSVGAKSVKPVDKSADKLPDKKLDKRTAKLTAPKGGKIVGGKGVKKSDKSPDKSPDKKSDKKAAKKGAKKVVKKVVQKAAKKASQKTVSKVPQKRRKRPLKLGDVVELKTAHSDLAA